jgi:hypothetical protein
MTIKKTTYSLYFYVLFLVFFILLLIIVSAKIDMINKKIDLMQQTRVIIPIEDLKLLSRNLYLKGFNDWGNMKTPAQVDSLTEKLIKKLNQ